VTNLAARRNPLSDWSYVHTVFPWDQVRRSLGLSSSEGSEGSHYEQILAQLNPDWRRESPVGLSFLLDTRVYMINQLLRDSDATSMAHSLELRVPFVDREVVEFSRSCYDHHKLLPNGGTGDDYACSGSKRVLIHALRDVLPLSVASRPKRGFVVPLHPWLRTSLVPLVEETCHPEVIGRRGLIDPRLAAESWRDLKVAPSNATYREIWALMVFELWCRRVLDQPLSVPSRAIRSAL
jgi:asparagine synthetase B (glutamine-hydrolysing)